MSDGSPNFIVRGWRGYERGLGTFVGWVARGYGRLGSYTAQKPVLVLLVTLGLALLTCLGWIRFRNETDSDVLWVPQTGKSRDDEAYVKAYYPKSKDGASFYAQLKPSHWATYGGNNALQLPVTWEMFKLHNKVMNLTVTNSTGHNVTFVDLCYKSKATGLCDLTDGYLWFWYKNFNTYLAQVSGSATDPTQGNETAFRQQISSTTYPDGEPVSLLAVFGGTTYGFNPFRLTIAEVIASDYSLDDSIDDSVAKDWNDAFTDLMKAELPKQTYMTFTWLTGSSVDEELDEAISGDTILVIISIIVFIIIAIFVLSKFHSVNTRTTLALAGVFVVGLGMLSGWGWGMIFGMPFTPLQQLSPFILLGMGVDVMFILVKSYDIIIQREPWLTLPESFSKLMSTAGLSVQVTLLASVVAFSLGAVDDLPSVKWFSAFACLNTLMILVLMMTSFVAFMVLTEKRIAANYWDCLCCWHAKPSTKDPLAVATGVPVAMHPMHHPGQQQLSATVAPVSHGDAFGVSAIYASNINMANSSINAGNSNINVNGMSPVGVIQDDQIKDENMIKKFFRLYYAPFLKLWWVKVIVILIFVAAAVASFFGIYRVKYGQPLSDLAPDGSYVQDYDSVQEATYRQQVGSPSDIFFRDLDFATPDTQYKMLKAWDMTLQNEFVNATTTAFLSNWLVDFLSWAQDRNMTVAQATNNCYNPMIGKTQGNLGQVAAATLTTITGCIPAATFYPALTQYLNGTGSTNDVIRDPSTGKILTCKQPIMLTASGDDDKYSVDMIDSIHSLDSDINAQIFSSENSQGGDKVIFIYGSTFLNAEGDAELPTAAMLYFILALVGVGVVCTFMLVNPLASLLMMISVGLVIVYLFGELWALSIRFNQVSVINMIMATGLAVDYAVYFAQKFMTTQADGTGNGRMQEALVDTGFAVFLGGITALTGSVPMAFAKSVIIRTFFKLIFGTILFSLAVGLILMPVVFSILAPLVPPVRSALSESDSDTTGPLPPLAQRAGGNGQGGKGTGKGRSTESPV